MVITGTVACNCQHNQTIHQHSDPSERGLGHRAVQGAVLGQETLPQLHLRAPETFLPSDTSLGVVLSLLFSDQKILQTQPA